MITLAAFVIIACTQSTADCRPLDYTYDTSEACRAAIIDLTRMWSQEMDVMLMPKMSCRDQETHT
jgi:hypothetical protein